MIATTTTTPPRTDAELQSEVLNELACDSTVDATEVGVQVKRGVVTLTGSIPSYPKKIAAVEAAHRVRGVLDVVNSLQVRIPALWERTDEQVAESVRQALKADVLVPDQRIQSTVSDGMVTLEGRVDAWPQRVHAEESVQRLTGVKGVVNLVSVARSSARAEDIKRQIEGALHRQADREAGRIDVAVSDGIVTLTGTVRSWAERNAIERAAQFAPGVRRVDDRTTLDPIH
jgi:osmotically-inducible protein OsmY